MALTFDFNMYNYRVTKVTNTGSTDITLFVNNMVSAAFKQGISYLINRGNYNITDGTFNVRTSVSGQALVIQRETKVPLLTGRISELEKGTLLDFAGQKWFLLDPTTGFMRTQSPVVNKKFNEKTGGNWEVSLTDSNNIWYYLNTTFYNTISAVEKAVIVTKNWGIGSLTGPQAGIANTTPTMTVAQMRTRENTSVITSNVGILSVSEWRDYSAYYNDVGGFLDLIPGGGWLRTKHEEAYGLYSFIAGKTSDSGGDVNQISVGKVDYYAIAILPALCIKPDTYVLNGVVVPNSAPTLTLNTTDNRTLYENDTILLDGQASDVNNGDIVNVKYSIDGGTARAITTAISDGKTPVVFAKQLTFKSSKLYDGEIALTPTLADGTPHILKVWAEDDKGGRSVEQLRTFYVVPNRAPLLAIDTIIPSGIINTDKFTISGTASDQDTNANVTVTYRINSGISTEIYNGPGGAWEFEVALAQLQVGENTIVVEAIDNYGAKTSKTIKLNKNEVKAPILQSVARYKITPPKGSAKGVLLFIERDEALNLKVELSMTLAGEQEQYVTLIPDNTAPMPNSVGIVEDTYFHESTEPKDNIILKLSTTRPDATVNHKIHLISGAVE